jgi:hypothetical protein
MTIRELEGKITNKVKDRIKSLGLVSSGALYKSISTSVKNTPNGLKIEIKSQSYLPYLDKDSEISDWVLKEVADDIAEVQATLLFDSF